MFGPKGNEVIGEWRRLQNEKHCGPYSSCITRVIAAKRTRWAERVILMRDRRGAHGILVGKPEIKRPLRWEDNITMDFPEVGYGGADWTDVVQGRDRWRAVLNAVMNLRVP